MFSTNAIFFPNIFAPRWLNLWVWSLRAQSANCIFADWKRIKLRGHILLKWLLTLDQAFKCPQNLLWYETLCKEVNRLLSPSLLASLLSKQPQFPITAEFRGWSIRSILPVEPTVKVELSLGQKELQVRILSWHVVLFECFHFASWRKWPCLCSPHRLGSACTPNPSHNIWDPKKARQKVRWAGQATLARTSSAAAAEQVKEKEQTQERTSLSLMQAVSLCLHL